MVTDPVTTRTGSTEDPIEVRLAIGLLQIVRMAMPDSYFFSDSRCELARETMKRRGFDPETVYA